MSVPAGKITLFGGPEDGATSMVPDAQDELRFKAAGMTQQGATRSFYFRRPGTQIFDYKGQKLLPGSV